MPTLEDYQVGLESGLVLGAGTDYIIQSWKGLGLQTMRTSEIPKPFQHGEFLGPEYIAGKTVDIGLHVQGTDDDDVTANVDSLIGQWYLDARASVTYGTVTKLHVKLPGKAQRFLYGRPRRSELDPDNIINGYSPGTLQYKASDPLWYSADLHTQVMNLATAPSGRGFNKSFDYGWGGSATSGAALVTNSGTASSLPTFTLAGPLTNIVLTNETTGASLTLTYTLGSGETLVVDFREATIKLNGTASRYYAKTGGSFWELAPGNNSIRFQAQSGSGIATLEWRDAWL